MSKSNIANVVGQLSKLAKPKSTADERIQAGKEAEANARPRIRDLETALYHEHGDLAVVGPGLGVTASVLVRLLDCYDKHGDN